ncbi:MAG: hypothetical protein ACKVQV_14180 [Bacteroidia bacterium]
MPDLTESYFTGIQFEDYRKISDLPENENSGEHLRIRSITETEFNPVKEFDIEPERPGLLENEYFRRHDIDVYYKSIVREFESIYNERQPQTGSTIIKAIIEELNYLASSNSDKKTLIINSDLMEKSALANFYNPATFLILKNDPESLINQFKSKYKINSLKGIEMYFVYLPQDQSDGERFDITSSFCKKLFESFGAKVNICGGL